MFNLSYDIKRFVFQYYIHLLVNFGWDYTLQFDWIRNNTEYTMGSSAYFGNNTTSSENLSNRTA